MQFCNTPLCQQCSVALNHYVVARRISINNCTQQSALTQKHRQNINYLQLGGIINWLYAVMTVFAQRFNISSSEFERSTARIASLPGYAPGNCD